MDEATVGFVTQRYGRERGKGMAGNFTVRRSDADGTILEEVHGLGARTAAIKYGKNCLRWRFRGQHHQIIDGTPLPGMPEKIVAEYFSQAGE